MAGGPSARATRRVASLFLAFLLAACGSIERGARVEPLTYPESRKGDVVDDYHGTKVADPYRWMEATDSEETRAWIDAQNAVSRPYLERLPAREPFLRRLEDLGSFRGPGAMRRQGGAWIESVGSGDRVELLIRDDLDEAPRLRLDEAALGIADDEQLDGFRLSPGARHLAFTVSEGGSEFLELRVFDLERGELLEDRLPNLKFRVPFWTADGEHLVYWRFLNADAEDRMEVDRGGLVAVHRLGTPTADDRVLLRDEHLEETGVVTWSNVSSDGRFVVLFYGSDRRSKLSVIDLGNPLDPDWDAPIVDLMEQRDGEHTFAGSLGSTLYFLTSRGASLGSVVAIDVDRPTEWKTVVPEGEHLMQHALIVGGRIVSAYRRDVKSALEIFEPDGTRVREVPLPAPGSTFYYGGEPDAPDLVFGFDATTVPARRLHHDVATGETRVLEARVIPDSDPDEYVSRQVFYTSHDGTRVPMFICYRTTEHSQEGGATGSDRGKVRPTILHGYGASGAVMDPMFRDDFFVWIEAGGIVAIANVRGGGEYGKAWTDAGRLDKKQNTYDDFVAAAEFLIAEGFTSPEHLSILGYSNGGMLVGAAMTQRPDLFSAAIPVVGVLDALRFPTTTAGPRWAKNQGDASIPEQFPWVHAWSPLHRIVDGTCYPATLLMTAANDDLVRPSQSYKFAARLQAAQGCDRPTVLRVLESGGHAFSLVDLAAQAEVLAFAAEHTGLDVHRP